MTITTYTDDHLQEQIRREAGCPRPPKLLPFGSRDDMIEAIRTGRADAAVVQYPLAAGFRFKAPKAGLTASLVSDAQVTALMAQWHFQCAAPGCNHARFIEFHHIVAHAGGGPTALWNLVPLCSSCHSLVTVGVLRIDLDGDRLLFRFPGGVAFASENRSTPMRIGRDGFRFADQPEEYAAAYSPGA